MTRSEKIEEAARALLHNAKLSHRQVTGLLVRADDFDALSRAVHDLAAPQEGEGGGLVTLLDGFDAEIERRSQELQRPRGGQSVTPGGDFVNVTPSVLGRLRWWSRAFRAALSPAAAPSAPEAAPPPVAAPGAEERCQDQRDHGRCDHFECIEERRFKPGRSPGKGDK